MAEERDWKDTVNLPRTDFPMRANLAEREPEWLARWDEMALYQRIVESRRGAPRFILHDGPPYANGHIHHGHILNKILKDIVVKFQTLSGRLAEYIPGWDCHGLPIEHEVDKQLGPKRAQLGEVEIRAACREYAQRFVSIQESEFKRLGVLGDWEGRYTTLDHYYEATCLRELAKLVARGLTYKALRPVHWSYGARSALAEAEVEYKPFTAPSVYVRFAMPEPPGWLAEMAGRPVDVVIWTTTPWTLPANLAVALHPNLDYVLVGVGERALILAEGLAASVYTACGLENPTVLGKFPGQRLVGAADAALRPIARHPFIDRDSVLLPATYVTLDQGTGCVHTAPGHGEEDYELGRQFGLDVLSPVDDAGRFTEVVGEWAGLHVFEANPKIVEKLHSIGALLNKPGDTVKIERYPHCWRTKLPVIFRATPQWFVSVDRDGLRQRALQAVKDTQWIPNWGEDRIRGMLESRPDWNISRQRVWGVPIPAVDCRKCGEILLRSEIVERVAELTDSEGVDCWFTRPLSDFLPPGTVCPACGSDDLVKEKDILDVWFESGASFAAVLERRLGWGDVADLYLEGSDQHRGWFHSSLLISVGTRAHAPYKSVLTHGFVVDEEGRKYSKSSKNFESPDKIIKTLGAEILRLWVAAVDYRGDIALSPEILRRMVDAYRRIRNTARFVLGNLHDFDPARHAVGLEALTPLDRWALDGLAQLVERLSAAYRGHEYHVVFHRLLEYCTVDLSQIYLDSLKDRLYLEHPDAPARRASQTVLWEIGRALAILASPILAFTTDEVWGFLPRRPDDPPSVHLARLPEAPAGWIQPELRAGFDQLLALRGRVQEAIAQKRPQTKGDKREGQIGSSQEARVRLTADDKWREFLAGQASLLPELFIVSAVEIEAGELAGDGLPTVTIEQAAGQKCPRCWNYRIEFGTGGRLQALCRRCAEVVERLAPAPGLANA